MLIFSRYHSMRIQQSIVTMTLDDARAANKQAAKAGSLYGGLRGASGGSGGGPSSLVNLIM